jgi:hypothetical protein
MEAARGRVRLSTETSGGACGQQMNSKLPTRAKITTMKRLVYCYSREKHPRKKKTQREEK